MVVAPDSVEAEAFSDVLLGLKMPVEGRIRVDRDDVTMSLPTERKIGLVPAGAGLLPHLTVEKNLTLATRYGLPPSFVDDVVKYLARDMTIQGFLRSRPHELAHDERLRIAVARARLRPVQVIVVEDHAGCDPCHAAVSAALNPGKHSNDGKPPSDDDHSDLAVLVVTDDRTRVASLASPSRYWEITNVAQS
ncbi:ATP-binding cassette domain-containing protein [Nonomuraea sp. NPDC046802]|uniref:ATP-binding cassette domain-containing protein n=1 Tax=Nonomuraea sp. NPDC046802 TaxID=3154919 RepID=UPI0033EAB171